VVKDGMECNVDDENNQVRNVRESREARKEAKERKPRYAGHLRADA